MKNSNIKYIYVLFVFMIYFNVKAQLSDDSIYNQFMKERYCIGEPILFDEFINKVESSNLKMQEHVEINDTLFWITQIKIANTLGVWNELKFNENLQLLFTKNFDLFSKYHQDYMIKLLGGHVGRGMDIYFFNNLVLGTPNQYSQFLIIDFCQSKQDSLKDDFNELLDQKLSPKK